MLDGTNIILFGKNFFLYSVSSLCCGSDGSAIFIIIFYWSTYFNHFVGKLCLSGFSSILKF